MYYKGLDLLGSLMKIETLDGIPAFFFKYLNETQFEELLSDGPMYTIYYYEKKYIFKLYENKPPLVLDWDNPESSEQELLLSLGFENILNEVSLYDLVNSCFN